MDLVNKLQTYPQGILFAAIKNLKQEEIPEFWQQYVSYMGDPNRLGRSHLATINPEEAARRNVKYALSLYLSNLFYPVLQPFL